MGVRHPAAPLGLISVAAMLPGSWTAHLVDCNTASITDGDFGERNVSQQADTLRSTQRCKQRTTILPQTSPLRLQAPARSTFAIDGYEPAPRQTIRHSSS